MPFEELKYFNIEPTNICNLQCIHCNDTKTRKKGFITMPLMVKIVNQCHSDMQVRFFLSGEPLMHNNLDLLIKIASKKVKETLIHTNATLLNGEWSEKLIKSGLSHISFSFDGYDKKSYEAIRKNAVFEDVGFNIRQFLKMNDHKIYAMLQVIVPQGIDYPGEEHFKKMFPEIDKIFIRRAHSWDEAGSNEIYTPKRYPECCDLLWMYMSIQWSGETVGCCADLNGRHIIGDANSQTLEEIWNSGKMVSLRERQIKKKPIPELCDTCERYGKQINAEQKS